MKLSALWGRGATAATKTETDEEKATRLAAEEAARVQAAADAAAAAEDDEDEEDDDDDDEEKEKDDEATTAEVAKVSPKARASIARAERGRLFAIIDAGGPTRVKAALTLAFGSPGMSAKAGVALVKTFPETDAAADPAGGHLGLQGNKDGRRPIDLGSNDAGNKGEAAEVDAMVASIVKAR